jgi:hypothetical protein
MKFVTYELLHSKKHVYFSKVHFLFKKHELNWDFANIFYGMSFIKVRKFIENVCVKLMNCCYITKKNLGIKKIYKGNGFLD